MGTTKTAVTINKYQDLEEKPFIDIFYGIILLHSKGARCPKGVIWNKKYRIRVIEARRFHGRHEKKGTVLSRVTKHVFDQANISEDQTMVHFLTKDVDDMMQKHADRKSVV